MKLATVHLPVARSLRPPPPPRQRPPACRPPMRVVAFDSHETPASAPSPSRGHSVPLPTAAAARDLVSRFRGRRLAVFGDLMLNRYLWGRVERISPEAPVPV